MLESTPTSGESLVFTELVYELRRRAVNGADVLDLLAFTAQELGGSDVDFESVVPIGPNSSAVLRLALIYYLDLAFGVVPGGLASLKDVVWCIYPDGDTFASTNRDDVDAIKQQIEQNRDEWCGKLGDQ